MRPVAVALLLALAGCVGPAPPAARFSDWDGDGTANEADPAPFSHIEPTVVPAQRPRTGPPATPADRDADFLPDAADPDRSDPDTDRDGILDGWEWARASDPAPCHAAGFATCPELGVRDAFVVLYDQGHARRPAAAELEEATRILAGWGIRLVLRDAGTVAGHPDGYLETRPAGAQAVDEVQWQRFVRILPGHALRFGHAWHDKVTLYMGADAPPGSWGWVLAHELLHQEVGFLDVGVRSACSERGVAAQHTSDPASILHVTAGCETPQDTPTALGAVEAELRRDGGFALSLLNLGNPHSFPGGAMPDGF